MKPSPMRRGAPDRDAALLQYRRRSSSYDLQLAAFEPIRLLAIDSLGLRRGQTVLDVGCGTGLSLARLQRGVGADGTIIGVEQCPEMIEQAQQRVLKGGYANVRLLCSPAEEAAIDGPPADAALFHFTHDILRRADALDHLLPRLRRGASVVATGLCWAPPWALPVNLFVWGAAALSVTSFNGLEAPWSLLASRLDDLQIRRLVLGGVYVVNGRAR